ncbi:hypothetical protein BpHYR1_049755 [Brachionus plicatilis]|uniref:Uncharacterized protein n=1 Tax=Brachionus plicatilis TaxID=10195 RepID=A0A3M7RLW1_BRAPC|nr:hypothetical protein BpHYR1_049755 [Brachionus plicatilis]
MQHHSQDPGYSASPQPEIRFWRMQHNACANDVFKVVALHYRTREYGFFQLRSDLLKTQKNKNKVYRNVNNSIKDLLTINIYSNRSKSSLTLESFKPHGVAQSSNYNIYYYLNR